MSHLPWTSGTFVEVKNLAWLFNSYFFFKKNESADQLGWSNWGNHKMYILYVQTAQRWEFKHFSSIFLLLQLSLIYRMHFLMSTLTSLLINYEIHAIFFSWNRTRTSHTCSCWLSGGKKRIRKSQLAPHLRPALNKEGLYKEKLQMGWILGLGSRK